MKEKQHYVPSFYLKSFLNSENEVEILNADSRKIVKPRGPKGICYERFFYGLNTGEPDIISQEIENAFMLAEDELARELPAIISTILENRRIDDDQKWLLGYLMSMLWMRGPRMREFINNSAEQFHKMINDFTFKDQRVEDFFNKFDEDTGRTTSSEMRAKFKEIMMSGKYKLKFNNAHHIKMFQSIGNFANLFWGMHWKIYISKLPHSFITSDNPVAEYAPHSKKFYMGSSFLMRKHFFALTPEIAIETFYPKKQSGKKVVRKTLMGEKGAGYILRQNFLIANQAIKYVYAKENKDLEVLLHTIKNLPIDN